MTLFSIESQSSRKFHSFKALYEDEKSLFFTKSRAIKISPLCMRLSDLIPRPENNVANRDLLDRS